MLATDESKSKPQTPKTNGNGNGNGKCKKPWYKDRTYLFMIAVFAVASCLLVVQAQQQQFNKRSEDTGDQLLVGQNQTLILVNKTAVAIVGNGSTLLPGQEPGTLEGLKNLLTSINQTLSNPNRTIKTTD